MIRAISFVLFLLLGIHVAFRRSRRSVNLFLMYVIAVNAIAGITQVDNWPFSQYTLAAFLAQSDRTICQTDFVGVSDDGGEWRVDPMAFSPVYASVLQYWFETHYASLSTTERDAVLRFLMSKAERARERLAAGKRIGFQRRLGMFASAYWWLLPRATKAARDPYVGLRAYRTCYVPDVLAHDPHSVTHTRIAEWPR